MMNILRTIFIFYLIRIGQSKVVKRESDPNCDSNLVFLCDDGSCIDQELVCDGKIDCDDKSDEKETLCKTIYCPTYAFRCSNGACISGDSKCDGIIDCVDGSDELAKICPGQGLSSCNSEQFECESSECIDIHRACDGIKDCLDGSDETEVFCKESFCPTMAFRCDYGACVRSGAKCDGFIDCADKSDEKAEICGYTSPRTPTTTPIIPRKNRTIITTTARPTRPPSAGSCIVPNFKNGRVINTLFDDEYFSGDHVENQESVEIVCDPKYSLLLVNEDDNQITCNNGKWSNVFSKCQKLCMGEHVLGRTTKTDCERDGVSVPCEGLHAPGTTATVKCKSGYRLPDRTDLRPTLTCLESGDWDYPPFRCTPKCGVPTAKAKPYVVNGRNTDIAEVPWHVAIYRSNILICGGTIITEKIIISAAHCFFKEEMDTASTGQPVSLYPKSQFVIVAGKYYRDLNADERLPLQIFKVADIITVPGYDGYLGYFAADIALIVLEHFIEFRPHIAPICLDRNLEYSEEKIVRDGWIGLVAGWGYTEADGKPSETLKTANLPVVNFQECKRKAPSDYKQFITPDKFCAGYVDSNDYGVCQGDSGGGFVVSRIVNDEKVYYLNGVVSNGRATQGACDLNFYTLFVNVQEYISYIKTAERDHPTF